MAHVEIRQRSKREPDKCELYVWPSTKGTTGPRPKPYLAAVIYGRDDAEVRAAEIQKDLNRGRFQPRTKETTGERLLLWLAQRRLEEDKDNTRNNDGHQTIIEMHLIPRIGHVVFDDLTPEIIRSDILHALAKATHGKRNKPYGKGTIVNVFRTLQKCCNDAVGEGRIAANPCMQKNVHKGVVKPKTKIVMPTKDEVDAALRRIEQEEPMMFIALWIALTTGMRLGEILGLQWCNIRGNQIALENAVIYRSKKYGGEIVAHPKTDRGTRSVSLAQHVVEKLRVYRLWQAEKALAAGHPITERSFVCEHPVTGKRKASSNFSSRFSELAGFSIHKLRHRHISVALAEGKEVMDVAKRVGHANHRVTQEVYQHHMPKKDDAIVAMLDEGVY